MHSVDMGSSAPQLSRARVRRELSPGAEPVCTNACVIGTGADCRGQEIEYDMSYIDSVSISISTSVLFNYPFPSFARLPVSLTISLSLFASSVSLPNHSFDRNESDHRTFLLT